MKRTSKLAVVVLSIAALAAVSASARAEHTAEQHKGPFIQAGAMGSIDLGIGDNFRTYDIGPGAFVGLGYNWGLFGVRTHFNYAQMDGRQNTGALQGNLSSDMYGSGLELKISPLGESDIAFQPYLVAGVGANYLENNFGALKQGDWGFQGNGGVGFDFFITDGLAFTMETNIRPSVYQQDPKVASRNSYDMFYYDFMGGLTYVFGAKAKEHPTPVAAVAAAPVVAEKKYREGERIDLKGRINFKTASAEILPGSYPVLDDAVAKMKAHPELAVVEIEGHTDARGKDDYNMGLSQRRADSVKKYFESKGIPSSRLRTKGYGETQPIASNDTADGMAENRRIVFRVVEYKDR